MTPTKAGAIFVLGAVGVHGKSYTATKEHRTVHALMIKSSFPSSVGFFYRNIARRILFLFDPETVHECALSLGEILGKISVFRKLALFLFASVEPRIAQNIAGIPFRSPVGLAAGFDYRAKLVRFLPSLGFGFETIGTITNDPCEGNPKPRLGRLVRSRSLLVNKGFKNEGIHAILKKLESVAPLVPLGISIGKTNSKEPMTQEEAAADVVAAFCAAEKANTGSAYYELNISCPNLYGNIEFYSPEHLDELLRAVFSTGLSKPLFVKMPIDKTDDEVRSMLRVISAHPVKGVIFGNLQKNRGDISFRKEEVEKATKGNFSGKPTWRRSNELIRLAYRECGKELVIIGCGGVFSAEDAYAKIKCGASLVQLITGLVFQGPQLVAEINNKLPKLLASDGFSHISQAIGSDV